MTAGTQAAGVLEGVREIAQRFAADRSERQRRTHLDAADFAALADAGFTRLPVPVADGGEWESVSASTRRVAEHLRVLAGGDPSVALVASMHPAVLMFWLASPGAPAGYAEAWAAQRSEVFAAARDGRWWGTITSEPGSGGDIGRTKSEARRDPATGGYRLHGQKHFGSGSGMTSFMITSAVPEGTDAPDLFWMDVRGASWEGDTGMRLLAPWDGHGMIATQSHAFEFSGYPVTRFAWEGDLPGIADAAGGAIACLFAAVVTGIVERAVEEARASLARRRDSLRAYEQMEWSRACTEAWLVQQAYEGMVSAVEREAGTPEAAMRGKAAISELAESVLARICRVLGGGTFNRASPFGYWFEDVRALGFLRPPWGLMHHNLAEASLPPVE